MRTPLFSLTEPTPDAIFAIAEKAKAAGPAAINGTVGIFLDEQGKPMLFPSVKAAITDLASTISTRSYSYPALTGLIDYRRTVETLVFGANHGKQIASIATTGGTGALAIALRLARMTLKEPEIVVAKPTWTNHLQLIEESGVPKKETSHIEDGRASVSGIIEILRASKKPLIVLLHVGCHNPTGLDLTRDQWEEVLSAVAETGSLAILDCAYQGFAGTPEEDSWPIRRAAELHAPAIFCWSASKNHGIYSERTGMLGVVCEDDAHKKKIEGHLMTLTRKLHSASATFGQSIVAWTQSHHSEEWYEDMRRAREVMMKKRGTLLSILPKEFTPSLEGYGMFALLPLSPEQVDTLAEKHLVFLTRDGRLNIAGIPFNRIEELGSKISTVWSKSLVGSHA